METLKIVFNLPDRDTPGFPRRVATALEFQEKIKDGTGEKITLPFWKELIKFLSSYVEAATPEQAEELLWMASQAQLEELLAAVSGKGQSEVVPPPNGGESGSP